MKGTAPLEREKIELIRTAGTDHTELDKAGFEALFGLDGEEPDGSWGLSGTLDQVREDWSSGEWDITKAVTVTRTATDASGQIEVEAEIRHRDDQGGLIYGTAVLLTTAERNRLEALGVLAEAEHVFRVMLELPARAGKLREPLWIYSLGRTD